MVSGVNGLQDELWQILLKFSKSQRSLLSLSAELEESDGAFNFMVKKKNVCVGLDVLVSRPERSSASAFPSCFALHQTVLKRKSKTQHADSTGLSPFLVPLFTKFQQFINFRRFLQRNDYRTCQFHCTVRFLHRHVLSGDTNFSPPSWCLHPDKPHPTFKTQLFL